MNTEDIKARLRYLEQQQALARNDENSQHTIARRAEYESGRARARMLDAEHARQAALLRQADISAEKRTLSQFLSPEERAAVVPELQAIEANYLKPRDNRRDHWKGDGNE